MLEFSYFGLMSQPKRKKKILLPGGWTSEKRRLLSSCSDCATPVGPIAHYESLVHSGLLLEDNLQRSALWQLDRMHGEMARYTNLPLPQTEESGKESRDEVSDVSKPEQRVKDVAYVTPRKECDTEKVSVLYKEESCHA